MRIKAIVLLVLAISLSFAADYALLVVPVSSASLPVNSGSAAVGQSAADPVVVENFPSNVTITGNLNLTGNSVVDLVGVSKSNLVNVYLYGSIFINDNATLVIKYANLYFMGATKPYGCNITLSNSANGHPRLDIGPAVTIDAYTSTNIFIGRIYNKKLHLYLNLTEPASYGAAIFAYDNAEISANGLVFKRQTVYNYSLGGPTLIECRGESSASLTSVEVDSVLTYDMANVTIYTGTGTIKVGKGTMGVVFGCYNSSTVNLYNVYYQSIVASDETHWFLHACPEIGNSITATDQSQVEFYSCTIYPVVNATGDSYVSLSASTLSTNQYGATVASIYDNATLVAVNGSTVTGWVFAFDNSRVVMNKAGYMGAAGSIGIVSRNSSSISILDSTLSSQSIPVVINLFDGSKLSLVNSTIDGGLISSFNDTTVYASGSFFESAGSGLKIVLQDNTNVTMVGCSIDADSLQVRDDASLSMENSMAWVVYCLNSSRVSIGQGSVVSELRASDSAELQVYNSTLYELSLTESNVTGSVSGLAGFIKNSTIALSGSNLKVSLLNTKVSVSFQFSGLSNVIISNSTLGNLYLLGSSVVTLRNASVSASPKVFGNSSVVTYSSLRVRCVDYFGNPLNSSLVTISGYPGTTPHAMTDKDGLASFVVFSEFDNATASFPLGAVTVKGSSGGVSTSREVSLTSLSQEVTLSFPLPTWSSYILPLAILVGIVALLTVVYYVFKRVRGSREEPAA